MIVGDQFAGLIGGEFFFLFFTFLLPLPFPHSASHFPSWREVPTRSAAAHVMRSINRTKNCRLTPPRDVLFYVFSLI